VTIHRSRLRDADVTVHYGIPTTTPARTLADLADVLDPASLTRAVNEARLRHLTCIDALAAQLRPGRATKVLAALIARADGPTRSVFEDAFLAFCDRHHLPRPEVNVTVAGYEVDMLWRPQRLIAELDGRAFHGDFEHDRDKDADLVAAGHRVVRVSGGGSRASSDAKPSDSGGSWSVTERRRRTARSSRPAEGSPAAARRGRGRAASPPRPRQFPPRSAAAHAAPRAAGGG
jgi:hypothetical protein